MGRWTNNSIFQGKIMKFEIMQETPVITLVFFLFRYLLTQTMQCSKAPN